MGSLLSFVASIFVPRSGFRQNSMKRKEFALLKYARLIEDFSFYFAIKSFLRYISTIQYCQEIVSDEYLQFVSNLHEPNLSKKVIIRICDFFITFCFSSDIHSRPCYLSLS